MKRRFDLLSPSFFAGLVGYAIWNTGEAFLIGAAATWISLFALLLVASFEGYEKQADGRLEPAE
jgi:hypothetical protein